MRIWIVKIIYTEKNIKLYKKEKSFIKRIARKEKRRKRIIRKYNSK